MKRFLMFIASAIFTTTAALAATDHFGDDERPIRYDELPAEAKAFIAEYFAKEEVSHTIMDKGIVWDEYTVVFQSGVKLEFDDKGEWTGFDAEFARLFAEELGVECEFFVLADWGKKFMELETQNIDCVWNGMTLTEPVKAAMECANAYMNNAQVVVVPADKANDYQTIESLKDLTFAVEAGSAGEAVALENGFDAVKGMYIELSTPIGTPPLGIPSYHEVIARAFNTKYSTNFDKSKMNASFLTCEKIG